MSEPDELRFRAGEEFSETFRHGDRISELSAALFFALCFLPAAWVSGVLGTPPQQINMKLIYTAATVGSLLFFCLYYPERRYWHLGIIPGLIVGPLVLICTIAYFSWRTFFWRLEVVAPLMIGCAPAWVLWYLPLKWRATRDIEVRLKDSNT